MARKPALTQKKPAKAKTPRKTDGPIGTSLQPGPWYGVPDSDVPDKPLDQPNRGPGTDDAPFPQRVTVDVDTHVIRADLGPTAMTFVAANQQIPYGLEGHPRQPA